MMLRRHREGGYIDTALVHREPSREELLEQARADRRRIAELEAELASLKHVAAEPASVEPAAVVQAEEVETVAVEPETSTKPRKK